MLSRLIRYRTMPVRSEFRPQYRLSWFN